PTHPQLFSEVTAAPVAFLTGVCTLADWLGSDTRVFALKSIHDVSEPASITSELEQKAYEVLNSRGLLGRYCGKESTRIQRVLQTHTLRPLQERVLEIPLTQEPQLLILEAPMGEGKTEAALLLADRLLASGAVDKLYFALPTMATSNAMFQRLQTILQGATPFFDQESSLVLAHGKRQFQKSFLNSIQSDTSERYEASQPDAENLSALKTCNAFFAQSHKRSLLATAGVGTIDQALSAVLGGRHHWVKLLGLTHAVVIVDEVHAYDAYMQRILKRLLEWLRALGSHVILLSATLHSETKQKLAEAFGAKALAQPSPAEAVAYPLITHIVPQAEPRFIPCAHNPLQKKTITFKEESDADKIKKSLLEFAQKGAQCCLILNTVKKAQEWFEELEASAQASQIELLLFHSRFLLNDRNDLEEKVLQKFGKAGQSERTKGRILIATQVVEQSLDVDFDVMISELAPIDLLLQRAGRLHRHQENDALRQAHPWKKPCLFVYSPCSTVSGWLQNRKNTPEARSVYDASILYRTALLFEQRGSNQKFPVQLPQDIRGLVEEVYGDEKLTIPETDQPAYLEARQQWNNEEYVQSLTAAGYLQPSPEEPSHRLGQQGLSQEERDAPEREELEEGGTRLAPPSRQIIFVDYRWLNELDGREENNQRYQEFKLRLQEHSITVLKTMLRGVSSNDFDFLKYPEGQHWSTTRKRMDQEFPYEPKPLLLPFSEDVRKDLDYTFKGNNLVLIYSKTQGLKIDKR
ncbi:CRISPR-associated helicase Cas3', partial [Deltaproteobacteria bacterium TL4]